MFRRSLIPVWIGIIISSSMFLLGQETWSPPPPPRDKIVFVTAGVYPGALGGLMGADAICQSEADAAALTGEFKAWLSTSTEGPADTFQRSPGPYKLVSGDLVASDWKDLTNGSIWNPIQLDPLGNNIGEDGAWTNTNIEGGPIASDKSWACEDWTLNEGAGTGGLTFATNRAWTDNGGLYSDCGITYLWHLYCFEQ